MVLHRTAALIVRLSRAVVARPFKSIFVHHVPEKSLAPTYAYRSYFFPSIYRSIFAPSNAPNLAPFRMALDHLKRRAFYAAPSGSRLMFGLLGYTVVQQSSNDHFRLDDTLQRISSLFSKATSRDQLHDEDECYTRTSLDNYELGRLIGQGCNAAVYEARLSSPAQDKSESDIEILSRQSSFEICNEDDSDRENQPLVLDSCPSSVSSNILPAGQFNLAIKMLFNYGIQSNADAIQKAMEKELLPLRKSLCHSNVVCMYSCFVDSIPLLKGAHESYPMALPTRLSPDGYGRNKTLFIVMRRYDLTLQEYLQSNQRNSRERLLLFAQLLEALLYLNDRSIVHRDLKSDNILICNDTGELVLADFGCALHYPPDLKVPYQTDEVSKGGNIALMAPEIIMCQPSRNSYLDYRKADLWASGALFYEFFSQQNPFFHGKLEQSTYDDMNLPPFTSEVPICVERLVYSMLRKNPEKRPSVTVASNCIHLCLWFQTVKSKNELFQAYMWTALETLFNKHTLTHVEFNLKRLFFERQKYRSLSYAQTFLNNL